jgi:hypothetical protein
VQEFEELNDLARIQSSIDRALSGLIWTPGGQLILEK